MASKFVKCPICNEEILRKDGLKLYGRYYCKKHVGAKTPRDSAYRNLRDIIGENKSALLFREVEPIGKEYSFAKLNRYLEENKMYLQNLFDTKTFSSEYAKLKYLAAILRNNLPGFVLEEEKVAVKDIEHIETKSKKRAKRTRRGLNDII